jgi:PKD repeat protein
VILTITGPGGESSADTTISVRESPAPLSPPIAGLTADLTEGMPPLSVVFSDVSTGNVTDRTWDFGDGATSDEQNPIHLYNNPGIYTAVLTVTGPDGDDREETFITVKQPPAPLAASFTTDISEGTAPLMVSFTDSSTGEITDRFWDFGDGTTGTEQNPGHIYQNPGAYHAVLTVKGPQGESRADAPISVNNPEITEELKAALTPDSPKGEVPLTISFTDISSGEITGRTWNFGDGTTGTEQNPSHTYSTPGSYPVSFMDTSTGEITEYAWDFGDGSASPDKSPRHTYSVPGTYPVVLTVQGPGGESRTDAALVLVTRSSAQPWAEITADKKTGQAPLMVSFTDSSTGEITGWNWDFGDGATSDEKNADHTFTDPGTYTVALTATGPGGTSRSDVIIQVSPPESAPIASFNISSNEGNAPFTVSFTDSSSGNVTGWNWDFGDNSGLTEQNPTHTYLTPGTFTASLSISGPGGSGYSEQNITVAEVKPKPEADITADKTSGVVPFRVHLYPQTTGPVDGYLWDLGDGTISYDEEPVHIYETPGEYTISLTISGPGGVFTIDKPAYITARTTAYPPNASISADITSGTSPLTVTFTGSADEPVERYEWLFGDGTTAIGESALHTYQKAGAYDVTLIAAGPGGSGTTVNPSYITVAEPVIPLHASLTATPDSGMIPLTVDFTSEVTGEVKSYLWNFGDNFTSDMIHPNHTYIEPGSYPVSLTIDGPEGNFTALLGNNIEVSRKTNPPVATISADITSGTAPLHVSLSANTTGEVDGYVWDFGDGSSSYEINPTHAYAIPGNYSVRLTISGPEGSSEVRLLQPVEVLSGDKIPVAGFTAVPAAGYAPLEVSFTDTSTGTFEKYAWNLGDGAVSREKNPVHQYIKPGVYTVTHQVSGQAGRSEETKTDVITVEERPNPPVARFKADTRSGSSPVTVTLQDMSTGEITDWIWDLGDGTSSTEKNPVNTYTRPGSYSVNQTVIGPGGSDSTIRRGYIIVSSAQAPPAAAIYAEPVKGTAPLTVRFLDISEGDITGWKWDFGDNTTSMYKNPTHLYQNPGTYQVRLLVTSKEGNSIGEMNIRVAAKNSSDAQTEVSPEQTRSVNLMTSGNDNQDGQDTQPEIFISRPIANSGKPIADFTISTREATTSAPVSFTDTSTGKITGWSWSFGDGGVSAVKSPDYTYQTPGTFSVSLTVSGPDGTSSKRIRDAIQILDSGI